MSEEIIARIEAARGTSDLVGHANAERMLAEAWSSGRFAHAWLICGPPGIGKATLAWRFARYVLADKRDDKSGVLATAPDDRAAHQVAVGSHPDIRLVRRDYAKETPHKFRTEITVDNIRDLGPFLRQTAALGGWRVVIVDAADAMNRNAQNAVLKLLEEPPARTVFLLVCHAPARLLPTIRSRCRSLTLRPLEEPALIRLLGGLLPEMATDETAILARLAEGSAGRALDLSESGGVDLFRDLMALLQHWPDYDATRLHTLTDRFGPANGERAYRTFTDLLTWWLDRAIRVTATRDNRETDIVPGESELRHRLFDTGVGTWLPVRDSISRQIERADAVNLDRKQVVLNAFFGMAEAARR